MLSHVQPPTQPNSLQLLSGKLQQLSHSLALGSLSDDLIAQLKTALTSVQLESLYQQAISQPAYDFFPTPQPLIDKMLSLALLEPGMQLLEPSAGLGHICRHVRQLGINPDCFELSPLLQSALLLQGFSVIGQDFLASTPTAIYDRILANPPFSRNGVARHSLHALDWLRPGGRLVTVSHRFQLKPSATDRAFFRWLQGFDAHFYDCGLAFQHAERPCNIPIQLIVIDKPHW